jgi:hypothetical protein
MNFVGAANILLGVFVQKGKLFISEKISENATLTFV